MLLDDVFQAYINIQNSPESPQVSRRKQISYNIRMSDRKRKESGPEPPGNGERTSGRRIIRKFIKTLKFVITRTYREFMNDHCQARAGSLAFSTLLAIVPLTAFVVALLTAFGSFGELIIELQRFLVGILVPTKQEDFVSLIEEFVSNSQALGTVGFLLFAVTSINLIDNISMNINFIWGVSRKKNIFSKFTTYTSSILFGTLLIAVSFTGRRFLTNLLPPEVNALWSLLVVFVPTLFMYTAILLLIGLVPGVKVNMKYAAIGALVGVVFWELAKKGFVEGSSYVLRASVMYGSLALIPIFLFWLYIIWMIILASAELTYSLQFRAKPWSVHTFRNMDPSQRFSLGLQIFLMSASAFRKGDPPPDKKMIADRFGISLDDVSSFADIFQEADLLRSVGRDEWELVPAKPLDSVTFNEIIRSLAGKSEEPSEVSDYFRRTWHELTEKFDEAGDLSVEEYLIDEIVDEV